MNQLFKQFINVLGILGLSILLTACEPNESEAQKKAKAASTKLKEAMPVTVIQVQPVDTPVSIETVAQTEGAKETEIRPRVGGILLKRLYSEGEPVKAGQPMFLIDPEPFQNTLNEAQAQYREQSARIVQTKREEARQRRLLAEKFVSQSMYDIAQSNYAVAKAALQSAKVRVKQAKLNLSYTTVRSPIAGISGRFRFSVGALVQANTSLLTTISQLSPIWVRFSFSDSELERFGGRIREQNVSQVIVILPDGTEYEQKGRINFAASQIDPLLGTQQLRAVLDNDDQRLLPGQFVRVRVVSNVSRKVFSVPQSVVLTSDLGKYVYVVNDINEVEMRSVDVGDWVGKNWVILGGLNAGDKVVVDNIIKLRPGMAVQPQLKERVAGV